MNLFITYSIYHIFLARALAESLPQQSILVIQPEFSTLLSLKDALFAEKEIFKKIVFLNTINEIKHSQKLLRFSKLKKNIHTIKGICKQFKFGNIYVFNDGREEGQSALHYGKKYYPSCKTVYVEDGSSPYISYKCKRTSFVETMIRKLLFGFWWKNIEILGTSSFIDELLLTHPQLIRDELKNKPLRKFPLSAINKLKDSIFLKRYLSNFPDFKKWEQAECVLILMHSETGNQFADYWKSIVGFIDYFKKNGHKVAIKYHPRENQKDYLNLENCNGIIILPQEMPMELLYLTPSNKLMYVIGDLSTALFTVKLLAPHIQAVSMSLINNHYDKNFIRSAQTLNILLPQTLEDLCALVTF